MQTIQLVSESCRLTKRIQEIKCTPQQFKKLLWKMNDILNLIDSSIDL